MCYFKTSLKLAVVLLSFAAQSAFADPIIIQMNRSSILDAGLAALNAGRMERAIRSFEKALDANLTSDQRVVANNNLCIAFNFAGQQEEAIAACNDAIAIDGGYWKAYNNRANAYFELGEFSTASRDYRKALALNPGEKVLLENLRITEERQALPAS